VIFPKAKTKEKIRQKYQYIISYKLTNKKLNHAYTRFIIKARNKFYVRLVKLSSVMIFPSGEHSLIK